MRTKKVQKTVKSSGDRRLDRLGDTIMLQCDDSSAHVTYTLKCLCLRVSTPGYSWLLIAQLHQSGKLVGEGGILGGSMSTEQRGSSRWWIGSVEKE
jgi:hypothetical protein